MIGHEPFAEFALRLLICALAGALFVRLRQPVLIAYIVVGPAVLGLVQAHEHIELLAQVGVAVLLFVVGLDLDPYHLRHTGPAALATGLGSATAQVLAEGQSDVLVATLPRAVAPT